MRLGPLPPTAAWRRGSSSSSSSCACRPPPSPAAAAAARSPLLLPPPPSPLGAARSSRSVCRRAVERDVNWDPALKNKGPLAVPQRGGSAPPPPPPPQQPKTGLEWLEAPFRSRRNIVATLFLGSVGAWFWNRKVLPPVQVGEPPKDFPFQLAGYTDVAPEDFVYARTRGGNWVAAAQDASGRVFLIDQAGDLYYDTGSAGAGIYVLDPQGNLFNVYLDERGERAITPVGNVSQLTRFKISQIAGIQLDRGVTVVAMADGSRIPLPPGAGMVGPDGKFVPPGELIEGLTLPPPDNPFARLLDARRGAGPSRPGLINRYQVEPSDPTPYARQLYDQTLLDDPDMPGQQPALPPNFDLVEFARVVEAQERAKDEARRGGGKSKSKRLGLF